MVTDQILRILDQSYPQSATAQSMATQIGQSLLVIQGALSMLVMQGKAIKAPTATGQVPAYLAIIARVRTLLEQQTIPVSASTVAHLLGMKATDAAAQLDRLVLLQIATKREASPEPLYSKVS